MFKGIQKAESNISFITQMVDFCEHHNKWINRLILIFGMFSSLIMAFFSPIASILGWPLTILWSVLITGVFIKSFLYQKKDRIIQNMTQELPETFIKFRLENRPSTNDRIQQIQVVLISKANINCFRFSDICIGKTGYSFNLMLETIAPLDKAIIDIEACNTRQHPGIDSLFHGRCAFIMTIQGDVEINNGEYKVIIRHPQSFDL